MGLPQRVILNVLDGFDAERKFAEKSNADFIDEIVLIVHDQGLTGDLTGLVAAEVAIDGFLVKTEFSQLVPTALRICSLEPLTV